MTMDGPGVVAGFDGSAASARALEWAVAEAMMRHVPLTVCHTWDLTVPTHPAVTGQVPPGAEHTLARGVRLASRQGPGLNVAPLLLCGPAAATLLQASDGAEMLAAGTRGTGNWSWPGLGSVSTELAAGARCPLLLVPDDGIWRNGPIVAGVDSSPASQNAAGFAFCEAHLRHVPVMAVCWSRDPDELDQVTGPWRQKYPGVAFCASAEPREPAAALRALAETAPLLVVGARGADDIPGLRLGRVASELLLNAAHPIALIR